ncbi:deoxyribose-phosphate aldolase [Mycolicibacterium litorale]|nr:deoxyribose-phosphate aldolase [Mycolicibacterium litorale]
MPAQRPGEWTRRAGAQRPGEWTRSEVAALVDHTLLKPEAVDADVIALVAEAVDLAVFAVCVSPSMITPARWAANAKHRDLTIATVAGFPSGKHLAAVKAQEAALAAEAGAAEVDMVIDVGAALDGNFAQVAADIATVRAAIPGVALKVIVESAALLSLGGENTLVEACRAAEEAGADFVKTSTGFHPAGGASVLAVEIMAATVGGRLGIKASGGIRTAADALAMLDAGATRLGLSGTRAVLDGLR